MLVESTQPYKMTRAKIDHSTTAQFNLNPPSNSSYVADCRPVAHAPVSLIEHVQDRNILIEVGRLSSGQAAICRIVVLAATV
jgi:hypothetical protein